MTTNIQEIEIIESYVRIEQQNRFNTIQLALNSILDFIVIFCSKKINKNEENKTKCLLKEI